MSAATVLRKARNGEVPAAKTGRKWIFRRADLDEWLSAGGTRRERDMDAALVAEVRALSKDPEQRWVPAEQVDAEYAK